MSSITFIIFFLLSTSLGHKTLGYVATEYLSTKTENHIEVEKLDIRAYPKLVVEIRLNHSAMLHLVGTVSSNILAMQYHLVGETFKWNTLSTASPIDVKGQLNGKISSLKVIGEGQMFKGEGNFSFTKISKKYKDVKVKLRAVESHEILQFLKQKPLLSGRADINSSFSLFSTFDKKGTTKLHMPKALMSNSEMALNEKFELDATIGFEGFLYRLDATLKQKEGEVVVKNVTYDKNKKEGEGTYVVAIKELASFEKILKHQYHGAFQSSGHFLYENNKISLEGESHSFEGILKYAYRDESLDIHLHKVSLVKLLEQYNYPALLSAKVDGLIEYNLKDKILLINSKLRETRFRKTKMTNMIYRTTGFDLLRDRYDNSSFVGGYQNDKLNSVLHIDNGTNHIYLDETVLDRQKNTIDSKFNLRIQNEELYGTIYGTLEHPKVSIDMKKLLKYQMRKGLDSFFGENQKIDSKILKDTLKEKTRSLFNGFLN